MKVYGEVDVQIHAFFFTSLLIRGKQTASHHSRFTPGTRWLGGWLSTRAGLDAVEKRTFFTLLGPELRALGLPARSQ
jgi:hypothetical protein